MLKHRLVQLSILSALSGLAAAPLAAQERFTSVGTATSACAAAADLTIAQRGVAAAAAQGVAPLRQYVARTRTIFELDMMEVAAWLEQRQGCAQPVASAARPEDRPQ